MYLLWKSSHSPWHLCAEKLSLFWLSSSGRYIKTWTDWFKNAMPPVSLCSRWLHLKYLSHQALGQGLIIAWPAGPILPILFQEVLYLAPRALLRNLKQHKGIHRAAEWKSFFTFFWTSWIHSNYNQLLWLNVEFQTSYKAYLFICIPGVLTILLNAVMAGRIISVFHQQSGPAQNPSVMYSLLIDGRSCSTRQHHYYHA